MSGFLLNLIARSHEAGDGFGAFGKVEPRPRSRFEAGPVGETMNPNDAGDDSDWAATGGLAPGASVLTRPDVVASKQPTAPDATLASTAGPERIAESDRQSASADYRLDDLQSRLEAIASQLRGSSGDWNSSRDIPEVPHPFRPETTMATMPDAGRANDRDRNRSDVGDNEAAALRGFLDARRQTRVEIQRQTEPPRERATVVAPVSAEAKTEPQMSAAPEIFFERPSASERSVGGDARPEWEPADRDGQLLTPEWLNEIQAGFTDRWRKLNPTESEPVVNVTIGRIEVKAVRSNQVSQAKTRSKPVGVMSLDDYLKQRENRRGR